MAEVYGKRYSRRELLERVGDVSQVARIKPYRLVEGFEDGVLGLDVTTGSGFGFTVLPQRGLDISSASYRGCSLAWRSSTSDRHPAFFDHEGEHGRGWLRGFYGGLVVTCGLTYAGAAGQDRNLMYGLHGRASNIPATNVQWDGHWDQDEYRLRVRGRMREATVFGANLQLSRVITTRLGDRKLTLQDTVENMAVAPAEHMMLYHINIGFPVVDAGSLLIAPTVTAAPRDADAAGAQDRYSEFDAPSAGFREQVYFHDMAPDKTGWVTTAVANPSLDTGEGRGPGIAVYCTFLHEELPRFIEWKMLDSGTYVVGMEPANCLVMGRATERAAGTLQVLAPGECRTYHLEIGVLLGDEIASLDAGCKQAVITYRSGHPDR